jgi:hypothetical protein
MMWESRTCVLMGLIGIGCVDDSVVQVVDDGSDGSTDDDGGSTDDDGGSTDGDDGSTDGGDESTDGGGGSTDDGGSPDDGLELDPPSLLSIVVEPTPVHRPVQGAWPAAAFGGDQYLVVWEDHRLRRPILYGGRVTADGTALDPFGFRIFDVVPEPDPVYAYYGGYQAAVAFDGENFLVVAEVGGRIGGARVSPAGEVLDVEGFVIAAVAPEQASRPSLVFDGEQYLVAWSQADPGWGVFRARIEPDGTVLDPGGVLVHGSNMKPVGVSFDGTRTLLSWSNHDGSLDAGRIAEDGALIDDPPLRLTNEGENVHHRVAGFDGTNHVIVWASNNFGVNGGIRAARVTPEGTNLDPGGLVVDGWGEYWGIHRLDMAAGSGRSIVVWSAAYCGDDTPGCWADPVRAGQIAADGTTSVYPNDAFPIGLEAMVASHPNGALLLWRDGYQAADYHPIVGTRLDDAGVPVVDSVVAPASPASRQDVKAVASDGQNFFVLWTDTRDSTSEGRGLQGARVGADGTPLDLESLQFTSTPIDSAHVVFDGANFLVTWVEPLGGLLEYPPSLWEDTYFNTVRVSPAGERLDEEPLHPPLCRKVAGASDGMHTLLVGRECGEEAHMAVLLDQEGAVASEPVPIPGEKEGPTTVSFDGTGYLVVWFDQNQLFGQRITVAGALLGQPFSVNGASRWKAAGGGGRHLLVQEFANGIGAMRVSSDGQVLDPGVIVIASLQNIQCYEPDLNGCSEASVVFDGEDFVVACRAPSIPGHVSSLDLYAVKVSPKGAVSPRFLISQEPEREGAPFVAANGEGQVLAAYNRFVAGPPYDTRRAVARLLP